ncbi:aldo/keto reductase [Caulobacter soli]|uniref:aldo/keto reductase n=1 Tax=Caulobacter soli TaxID=2708539 RepID=UPI0013EC0C85|nr:aldo/keto reductase [Caulobacter soli]
MNHRPLGRSGLSTAPLVFGGNVFGWTADEATSFRLLDAFVDGGFNAIDTADVYSAWVPGHAGGESEGVIGRWLKARGKRDDVLILTKVAMWPAQPGLSAANIAAAVEGSLKRLQTDYIDLYQSHQDDAETPIEETLEAYDRLIKAGKVRAIGASNFTPERLAASLKVSADISHEVGGLPRYETIQPKFNLYDRDEVDGALAELTAREGLGVIPYYGLAAGFLTGKYRTQADLEGKARGRTVGRYLNDKGLRVLAALDAAAKAVGASQAQVALAWIMAHPSITAPIASATSVEQLNELMAAARLILPTEVVAALNAAG